MLSAEELDGLEKQLAEIGYECTNSSPQKQIWHKEKDNSSQVVLIKHHPIFKKSYDIIACRSDSNENIEAIIQRDYKISNVMFPASLAVFLAGFASLGLEYQPQFTMYAPWLAPQHIVPSLISVATLALGFTGMVIYGRSNPFARKNVTYGQDAINSLDL